MKDFLIKNRIGVAAGVFLLVVAPLFFYGFFLLGKKIEETSARISDLKIDQEVNQGFVGSSTALKEDQKMIDANSDNFSLLLKDEPQAKIDLFGQLENLARQTGHSTVDYEVLQSPPQLRSGGGNPSAVDTEQKNAAKKTAVSIGAYSADSISLNLSVTGTYENFLRLLHKIEHLSYMGDVLSMKIVAREAPDPENQLLFNTAQKEEGADGRSNLIDSEIVVVIYLDRLIADKKMRDDIGDGEENPEIVTK